MGSDNYDFIAGYEAFLGDAFFTLNAADYGYDIWVQDEFEFAYATSPDAHLDIIFDTLRDGQWGPGEVWMTFPRWNTGARLVDHNGAEQSHFARLRR